MTRPMIRSTLCLALFAALALPSLAHAQAAAARPPPPRQAEDPRLAGFDAYVDAVRKQFEVPGIAVAIVEDGRIVYERGFGPREVGKPAEIDEHTHVRHRVEHESLHLDLAVDAGRRRQALARRSRDRPPAVVPHERCVRHARDAHQGSCSRIAAA
jgi:hypothetical protein